MDDLPKDPRVPAVRTLGERVHWGLNHEKRVQYRNGTRTLCITSADDLIGGGAGIRCSCCSKLGRSERKKGFDLQV